MLALPIPARIQPDGDVVRVEDLVVRELRPGGEPVDDPVAAVPDRAEPVDAAIVDDEVADGARVLPRAALRRLERAEVGDAELQRARAEVPEVALPDGDLAAAVGQLHRVLAQLRQLAPLERGVAQAARTEGAIEVHVPLPVNPIVAVHVAIQMPERQVAEVQVLDEPARRRVAGELDHAGLHHRGDDLRGRQVLAGHRVIIEHTGVPVQVPLARLVERLEDIAQVIAEIALPEIHRAGVAAEEADDALLRVDLFDPVDRRRPRAQQHHVDVRRVGPRRIDVTREIAQRLPRIAARLAPLRAQLLRAVVRIACPHPRLAVDVKRIEYPLAVARLRHVELPERLARRARPRELPVDKRAADIAVGPVRPRGRKRHAAAQHRALARGRGIGHGRGRRPRVRRREDHRLDQRIDPAAQPDVDRRRERAGFFQLADRVAGALQRGKGFGLRAGIGVGATGRDVEFGRHGGAGGERQQARETWTQFYFHGQNPFQVTMRQPA